MQRYNSNKHTICSDGGLAGLDDTDRNQSIAKSISSIASSSVAVQADRATMKIGRSPSMARRRETKRRRLRVERVADVPLREVSGICLRRGRNRKMSLVAIGDHAAHLAWASLPSKTNRKLDWHVVDLTTSRQSAPTAADACCSSRTRRHAPSWLTSTRRRLLRPSYCGLRGEAS